MAKIALLGAGWLGEPLAYQLQQADHEVQASTTTDAKAQCLQGEGLDTQVLEITPTGIAGDPKDFFAADILVLSLPPGGRRDPAVEQNYPAKVLHIIAAAKAGGIKQVLFTSSTGIYGEQEGEVSEESPLLPVTNSGKALKIVEQQLRDAYGGHLTILRLAGLFGPSRQPGRWFAGKKKAEGGSQYVNLVHQADVLTILQAVIDQNAWGYTLNVCGDQHPTKAEFYPRAAKYLELEAPVFKVLENNKPRGKRVDNSKSKKVLTVKYQYTQQYFERLG